MRVSYRRVTSNFNPTRATSGAFFVDPLLLRAARNERGVSVDVRRVRYVTSKVLANTHVLINDDGFQRFLVKVKSQL